MTSLPSSAGVRQGRFGERLLGPLAAVLEADTPEGALAQGAALFASVSGGTAAVFRQRPNGEVKDEHWHPAGDELRPSLRPVFLAAVMESRRKGDAVERVEPLGSGPVRVWARGLFDESGSGLAVALAAPRSTPLGNPPDWVVVSQLVDLLARRIRDLHEIARGRAEREQRDRYFTMLDRQLRMLERERQKFVAVVNQSDTYAVVVDEEYRVTWTNTSTSERLAEEEGNRQWMGRALGEVWDRLGLREPAAGSRGCPVAAAFACGCVVHHEFQVADGGETRCFYLTALPVMGPEGRPDETLVLIQDLTNLESLRRSESRYRLLFERSPDAMLMVEPGAWSVIDANPSASRLLGWPVERLIGMPVRELHDPGDWKPALKEYEAVFSRDGALVSERALRGADGDEIFVNMSVTRFDLDGSKVALVEYQDVTETRRLEAELRHSQKMEAIGRLAGGVAHDFNNLLAVIQGQSELLISRLGDASALRPTAESVRKAAVRGSLLTRQLLAFSRKDMLSREVLDVRDIVAGIEAMLRSLVGGSITLHLELDSKGCRVDADRGQVEQVIMNLAVNARDAMPQGGNLWISVTRADRRRPGASLDRRVRLEVRDDGVGMDERTRTRLFEPFFTTKEQGRGTGLGLSSSYGIVRDLGGTIEVESSRGAGTRFVIELPRVFRGKSSAIREIAVHTDFERGTETILVVEDEDDVRDMAVEVLGMMGYRVLHAPSGREALERLRSSDERIDLLLTDVIMPGMGGGDLVREALPLRPGLKVIYMSGYTADDEMVRHDVAHAEAAYLQKPFSLDSLSRKVREVLGAPDGG